jgi:hypothetical protein
MKVYPSFYVGSMINSNKKLHTRFERLVKPFLNRNKQFVLSKYQDFFYTMSEKPSKEISRFFNDANKLILDMITSYHLLDSKELKGIFGYYMDLIILVASGLNVKARLSATDNSRSTVDVLNMDIKDTRFWIKHIYKKFKTQSNYVVVAPNDYSMNYNVADYTVLIFNKDYSFDLPHFYETKTMTKSTIMDDEQKNRIIKQKERAIELLKTYNKTASPFYIYLTFDSYFTTHYAEIIKDCYTTGYAGET